MIEPPKLQPDLPETRAQKVNEIGGQVGMQLTLMMLISCVSQLAEESDTFQNQLRAKLLEITETVNLPPGNEAADQDIREAARKVISNVFDGASGIQFGKRP